MVTKIKMDEVVEDLSPPEIVFLFQIMNGWRCDLQDSLVEEAHTAGQIAWQLAEIQKKLEGEKKANTQLSKTLERLAAEKERLAAENADLQAQLTYSRDIAIGWQSKFEELNSQISASKKRKKTVKKNG